MKLGYPMDSHGLARNTYSLVMLSRSATVSPLTLVLKGVNQRNKGTLLKGNEKTTMLVKKKVKMNVEPLTLSAAIHQSLSQHNQRSTTVENPPPLISFINIK
jgi:hypothetical protein